MGTASSASAYRSEQDMWHSSPHMWNYTMNSLLPAQPLSVPGKKWLLPTAVLTPLYSKGCDSFCIFMAHYPCFVMLCCRNCSLSVMIKQPYKNKLKWGKKKRFIWAYCSRRIQPGISGQDTAAGREGTAAGAGGWVAALRLNTKEPRSACHY